LYLDIEKMRFEERLRTYFTIEPAVEDALVPSLLLQPLVENAIKYSTGDKRLVRVETGAVAGGAWVRVSDTGPGIAPEHLPHLFDRFYRVDQARTRDPQADSSPKAPSGSGLGLSIVQWIARVHDGEVHVESTLGSGTVFEVRFKTG